MGINEIPMLVNNCFGWEHFHVYLSGPIDFDRDGGKDWREEWTLKLKEIGFKDNQIFNPCSKPLPKGTPFNLNDEAHIMKTHREKHEWKQLTEVLSQIAHVDLRLVDLSGLVLVNMPKIGEKRFQTELDILNDIEQRSSFDPLSPALTSVGIGRSVIDIASEMRIPTYGTIHEIVVARQQRKPVYLVWEGGKETCSAWMMWLVGYNNVFNTVDELITRLDNIAKGKTSYNAKDWLLLDL